MAVKLSKALCDYHLYITCCFFFYFLGKNYILKLFYVNNEFQFIHNGSDYRSMQ